MDMVCQPVKMTGREWTEGFDSNNENEGYKPQFMFGFT